MARKYQSHNSDSTKPNEKAKKKSKKKNKKKRKRGKDKVFSLGFVIMSLFIAVVLFFVFFIIGIQVAPDLPI